MQFIIVLYYLNCSEMTKSETEIESNRNIQITHTHTTN